MPDFVPINTLTLYQEQLDLLRRPRNEEWEKAAIAESKVHFLLLAMLSSGEIRELIQGQKVGKFWVTPKYRIAMEPHETQLDSNPRLVQLLKTRGDAVQHWANLLATEARCNRRQAPLVCDTSSEALTVSAPAVPMTAELDLSQFRNEMATIDRNKFQLESSSISHPFGQILDNTGQIDCISCIHILEILRQGPRCTDSSCPCFRNHQRYCQDFVPFSETLLTVYAKQVGLPQEAALLELMEKLGVSADTPLADLPVHEQSKIIHARATGQQFPLILGADRVVLLRSPDAQLTLGGIAPWRFQDGTKATLPVTFTSYSTGGWEGWFCIPFRKPYPLLNADLLHAFPECPVALTDCIEAAAPVGPFLSPTPFDAPLPSPTRIFVGPFPSFPSLPPPAPIFVCPLPTEVRTSWYGGREAVPHVDWKMLKGRSVVYWVLPHSGLPMEQHLATAVEVCFMLWAVPNMTLRFAIADSLSPWGKATLMVPQQFLEHAREHGLGELIDHLESEVHKGERRPMRRGERQHSPPRRPLLFPAILRAGETAVLYAKKGAGKSALAMRLAFCAATGTPFAKPWGSEGLQATKVLYLDGEMGDSTLGERVGSNRAYLLTKGIDDDLFSDHYERLNLYSDEGRDAVQELIRSLAGQEPADILVGLVVIDNLTSMTGSGDFQSGWEQFFTWCRSLNAKGITVLVVHHANDDGTVRGSLMKIFNSDRVMYLTELKSKSQQTEEPDPEHQKDEVNSSRLRVRLDSEHVRRFVFSEIKHPLILEFNTDDASWNQMDQDTYTKGVLRSLVSHGGRQKMDDAKIGEFWGLTARQIRDLREKYEITKYKKKEDVNVTDIG